MARDPDAQIELIRPDPGTLLIRLAGAWVLRRSVPDIGTALDGPGQLAGIRSIGFDASRMTEWDSMLVAQLARLKRHCAGIQVALDLTALPAGVRRLVDLATAVPERQGTRHGDDPAGFVTAVGLETLAAIRGLSAMLSFFGETVLALWAALRGRARYRWSDLLLIIQQNGPQALPIVGLVSLLVGMIIAFIGSIQLQAFAAEIYIANLVGIGVVREMGPMMTAIILAGRTSAAFAAQLGTMQVNEEISAFRTLGIPPVQFLVVPRVVALVVMVPLLVVYANVIGIFGGAIVALAKLNLSLPLFYQQLVLSVHVHDWVGGLIKSVAFGIIIVLSGCMRGLQAERSASAVGAAATSAVVTAIVLIIVADALFAIIYIVLGV